MYHKKVWIIILIIVVASLFPSILIAKAEEGEGGTGDIPDLEYSFQNAPFPGTYQNFTETAWQAFINRAEQLGHTEIRRVISTTLYFEDGNSDTKVISTPIYYSTNGIDVEYYLDTEILSDGRQLFTYLLRFKDDEKANWIAYNGHRGEGYPVISSWSSIRPEGSFVINGYWHTELWYSAEIESDPYQELPEKYNIDSEMGFGMYFIKPKNGEMITIPYKNQAIRDSLEIEIIVPQFYLPNEGLVEMLYEIKGEVGKVIWPNFVIRLYSNNVRKIWGSKSPNDASDWILQHDIEFVQGYYDEDGYMYAAKFLGKVPIDHEVPKDGGSSLIVADLYIDYSTNAYDRQVVRLDNARTWVRYLTTVGVVDEDGDGIDDRTGLPIYDLSPSPIEEDGLEKPDINDYDSTILGRLSYYWDSLVYYVKLPFYYIRVGIEGIIEWISKIGTFVDSFTSIFERLFSFLPAEVTAMLALGFSTLMIITIVRAIRGS